MELIRPPEISVIICTHNPNYDRLSRVLRALQAQSLSAEMWDLLLIDNASLTPVTITAQEANRIPIRMVRENELGLTPARLRGIRESSGELLVFVDDDNVLDEHYLLNATSIAASHPLIGAFGGSIAAEFEEPPPNWVVPYLPELAIREIDRDYWSNLATWSLAVPCGAGLCVRRAVAEDYARKAGAGPIRKALDRTGSGMSAGGDIDLAWCAVDLGMGTGRFQSLTLTHLIPKSRLTVDYITRLHAGIEASSLILNSFRTDAAPPREVPMWREMVQLALIIARKPSRERRILRATQRALREARALIAGRHSKCEPSVSYVPPGKKSPVP